MNYDDILLGLKTLSNNCDGARELDNVGFSRFDSEIGKSLASKLSLTDKQAKVGKSLVIKYGGQLDSHLVERVKSLEITIHTPSLETALNTLSWSSPKVVKGGTLQLEEANPTDVFWSVWKENKEILKPQGYSVAKDQYGNWKVNKWTTLSSIAPRQTSPAPNNNEATPIAVQVTVPEIPEDLLPKLLEHQPDIVRTLVKSLVVSGSALDASMCGSGKTFSSLAAVKTLGKKVLAICPKSGIPGWERAMEYLGVEGVAINYEQVKTGNTNWGSWRSHVIENSKGEKKTVEFFEWNLCDDVYVIIYDECHRLKNRDTINSQIAIASKLQGIKIILLSATAASNPLEMKALGYILDLFPLKKYWDWAGQHGVRKGRFGMEFAGGSYHLEKIHNSIFKANPPKGVRIRTKDIPGFPDCLIISEALDFDGENSRIQSAYDDMQDAIARLKERMGNDVGTCILTEILRARQKIELLKIPTLAEMTEDLVTEGNSVVVCLSFKESIQALASKLKTTCIIDGDNVGEKRERNRLAFQRGSERVCILSILCGESIDLDDQIGDYPRVELLCPDFSVQRVRQAMGRVHRAKSLSKAVVKFCYATGTIEDRARERVMEKARNMEMLNDADLAEGLNI